jgi:hypothetical protein
MPVVKRGWVGLACLVGSAAAAQEPAPSPRPSPAVTLTGSLAHWVMGNTRPRFSEGARYWLETSARLGATYARGDLTASVTAIGLKTTGDDPYGTGTLPAGAPAGTPLPSTSAELDVDEAYLRLSRVFGTGLRVTAGRQPIAVGTQFLIGDGVYDGFAAATRHCVWHNPRRSFDALRLEWERGGTRADSFVYFVDPTWDGGGGRDGILAGLDVSRTFARGVLGAGLFRRYSRSKKDNDMWIGGGRGDWRFPGGVFAGGEVAFEFGGVCRNAAYCTTPGGEIGEVAWHAEVGWRAEAGRKPLLEAGYVYYSADFTPVATGFSDWGKWYLGNQIDWIVFGTNTEILRVEAGFSPSPSTKLRLQYFHTREAEPTGGASRALSDEWTLIAEWYPNDAFWANAAVGWSRPGPALAASGLTNPFALLNTGAVPVGDRSTLDLIVGFGVRF